ncbi:hypothetical protein CSQ96_21175 [Janthinobacterium sp. BJB412]|nr:hypothetical protein CSQ96_21175 [Janthinobacterium sp. BJB412]
MILNGFALNLFYIYRNDEKKRDEEFRKFLTEYEDAVHNAYYTSVVEGRNDFLGYKLIARANGGAFGSVFQAVDASGEMVAIKVLHAEKLDDPDFYRNFRRGVNSLKILTDRKISGIVKFNDAVEIPPALIMEWIDGATLSDAVHLPFMQDWRARLGIMNRLSKILLTSHALPERVLHRDLRPANIMLRDFHTTPENMDLIVLDFDLSWHKGAEDHSVMYSPAMGYLAPEQRRKIGKSTTRTTLVDSYGFGMVMYYVISRRDPIPDMHRIEAWKIELDRATGSDYCSDLRCVPKRIARLIYNCTLENQNERMQMSQIHGELQSLLDYIDNPKELSSLSVLAEELAVRVEHMQGYTWNAQLSKAELHASAERRTSISADIPNGNLVLVIDWLNAGTQEWAQINRLLEKGVPMMADKLKKVGWKISQTKQSRSFHMQGTISAADLVEDIDAHAKVLDKALSHAFSMAGL